MSENKKTIKVLQARLLFMDKLGNTNNVLTGINIEDIYSILSNDNSYHILYYYKEIPRCELCGAGIVNGKCFYCNTNENDKGEIKQSD